MIASLERSSSSMNFNEDHDDEGGGRRSSSPNRSQRNSTPYSPTKDQRHSASYSHLPNKTQRPLPSRGTGHDSFSFFAPSPGAGRGPCANTREESVTWTDNGRKEKKRSNRPTKLASCLTHRCLHLCIPALARAFRLYLQSLRSFVPPSPSTGMNSPFVSTHSGSPFASTGTDPPFAQAPIDTAGLYGLGYHHVPLPLSSLPTGSSGSVLPCTIPNPLGVGGPGQQHARPLPLPPHNGQLLLVDPPLPGADVGGERKREGVATTVTDSGSVIHHPRPRSRVGVGLEKFAGLDDVLRDPPGDDVWRDASDSAAFDT